MTGQIGERTPLQSNLREFMPSRNVGGACESLGPVPARRVERDRVLEMRIRSEFHELRGLSLTVAQATRLFGIPREECVELLSELVDQGFLLLKSGDRYVLRAG